MSIIYQSFFSKRDLSSDRGAGVYTPPVGETCELRSTSTVDRRTGYPHAEASFCFLSFFLWDISDATNYEMGTKIKMTYPN